MVLLSLFRQCYTMPQSMENVKDIMLDFLDRGYFFFSRLIKEKGTPLFSPFSPFSWRLADVVPLSCKQDHFGPYDSNACGKVLFLAECVGRGCKSASLPLHIGRKIGANCDALRWCFVILSLPRMKITWLFESLKKPVTIAHLSKAHNNTCRCMSVAMRRRSVVA